MSAPIASKLSARHPSTRVRSILNGFDPDAFPGAIAPDRSRFTVLYAGSIRFGRHDVVMFLDGARQFLDDSRRRGDQPDLDLHFLGEDSPTLRAQLVRFSLDKFARCETRRPHAEAVDAMRAAPVLLFLPWQDREAPGVFSGKLFEYVGSRRPILAVGEYAGVAGALAEETGAGKNATNAAETAALLRELWLAHRDGRDAWSADERAVLRYSHEEMVRKFAEELDRCAG